MAWRTERVVIISLLLLFTPLSISIPAQAELTPEWRYVSKIRSSTEAINNIHRMDDGGFRVLTNHYFIEFPPDRGIPRKAFQLTAIAPPPDDHVWSPYIIDPVKAGQEAGRYSVVTVHETIRIHHPNRTLGPSIFDWEEGNAVPITDLPEGYEIEEMLSLSDTVLLRLQRPASLGGRLLGVDPDKGTIAWEIELDPGTGFARQSMLRIGENRAIVYSSSQTSYWIVDSHGAVRIVETIGGTEGIAWDKSTRRLAAIQLDRFLQGTTARLALYDETLTLVTQVPVPLESYRVTFADHGRLIAVLSLDSITTFNALSPVPVPLLTSRADPSYNTPFIGSATNSNVMYLTDLAPNGSKEEDYVVLWDANTGIEKGRHALPDSAMWGLSGDTMTFDPERGRAAVSIAGALMVYAPNVTGELPPLELPDAVCLENDPQHPEAILPDPPMPGVPVTIERLGESSPIYWRDPEPGPFKATEPPALKGTGSITLNARDAVAVLEGFRVHAALDGKNIQSGDCFIRWPRLQETDSKLLVPGFSLAAAAPEHRHARAEPPENAGHPAESLPQSGLERHGRGRPR